MKPPKRGSCSCSYYAARATLQGTCAACKRYQKEHRKYRELAKKIKVKGETMELPTDWALAYSAIETGERVLLSSLPGTGKTHAAYHHALNGRNLYSCTLTQYDTASALRGMWTRNSEGAFVWQDGIGIRAWTEGARLVINEIHKAGEDLLGFLHCLLDDPTISRLTLPDGRTVKPSKGFQVIATMNGEPREALEEALYDRFPINVRVRSIAPEALERLQPRWKKLAITLALHENPSERITLRQLLEIQELTPKVKDEFYAACLVLGPERAREVIVAYKLAEAR